MPVFAGPAITTCLTDEQSAERNKLCHRRGATSIETMSDTTAPTVEQQRLVRPLRISEEMVRLASGNGKHGKLPIDPWHIAANLNAMMEHGYCPKCGLCPNGCEREGCGPNLAEVRHGAKDADID
jgi:hypothetical protein